MEDEKSKKSRSPAMVAFVFGSMYLTKLISLNEPKSRGDLIMLLELACERFKYINALQADTIESGKIAEAA